jgi:uncharacterized protein (TIGR00730 family)
MKMTMRSITVFCGSSSGNSDLYKSTAYTFGKFLAERHIDIIYGGAKVGLMGALADGALQAGGQVIGVIPHFIKAKEIAHEGISEIILVDSMQERKTRMNSLGDGAVALPGGFGTLDELFEMLTWAQLGFHQKPIGILNIDHFYQGLIDLLDTMVDQQFLKEVNRNMLSFDDQMEGLINQMENYIPVVVPKWIT